MAKPKLFTIRVPGFEIVVRKKKVGPLRQPSFTGTWLWLITGYLLIRDGVISIAFKWFADSWNVLEPAFFIVSIMWGIWKYWRR